MVDDNRREQQEVADSSDNNRAEQRNVSNAANLSDDDRRGQQNLASAPNDNINAQENAANLSDDDRRGQQNNLETDSDRANRAAILEGSQETDSDRANRENIADNALEDVQHLFKENELEGEEKKLESQQEKEPNVIRPIRVPEHDNNLNQAEDPQKKGMLAQIGQLIAGFLKDVARFCFAVITIVAEVCQLDKLANWSKSKGAQLVNKSRNLSKNLNPEQSIKKDAQHRPGVEEMKEQEIATENPLHKEKQEVTTENPLHKEKQEVITENPLYEKTSSPDQVKTRRKSMSDLPAAESSPKTNAKRRHSMPAHNNTHVEKLKEKKEKEAAAAKEKGAG